MQGGKGEVVLLVRRVLDNAADVVPHQGFPVQKRPSPLLHPFQHLLHIPIPSMPCKHYLHAGHCPPVGNRRKAGHVRIPICNLTLHKPKPMSLDRSTIVRYLKADLTWDRESKIIEPISSENEFELCLHYKDSGKEEFEPALIWCQNTYDFEKVVLDNWPPDFRLIFKTIHPVSTELKIRKNKKEVARYFEMDLLQDYLRWTKREAFLAA